MATFRKETRPKKQEIRILEGWTERKEISPLAAPEAFKVVRGQDAE
ncbi:hypothetical protein [Fontibacter flavus]|uniref:Uncharacterized protein n=1 Tax=Fontibacter flavus TaxID=654838 RepID=A0ABV6FN49_9BACT